jgi:Cof subfamily protein (haloacid dehalogenase superfamily)
MALPKLQMVVTDLDGTLLNADHQISETDEQTLHWLGEKNIYRVAATGRTLYSANKVLSDNSPIDYLIFSCGAGIVNWKTKELMYSLSLSAQDVSIITHFLYFNKIDFQILDPVPDSHKFVYYQGNNHNPDFTRRIVHYQEFARSIPFPPEQFEDACEILAIVPGEVSTYEMIKNNLTQYKVIRATSPLDGKTLWVEIFSNQVSKGNATAWLCSRIGCSPEVVLGIGNDYNDIDLLNWTAHSFVVSNAPDELKSQFEITDSNINNGVTKAIQKIFGDVIH